MGDDESTLDVRLARVEERQISDARAGRERDEALNKRLGRIETLVERVAWLLASAVILALLALVLAPARTDEASARQQPSPPSPAVPSLASTHTPEWSLAMRARADPGP